MFNKTLINSYKASAVQCQKNVDFEELVDSTVPNILKVLISLVSEMCSQLQFFKTFFYPLVDPIENDLMQSIINKELHVIFGQFGITLVSFQKHDEIALTSFVQFHFLKTNLGYLSQIAFKNMQLLVQIANKMWLFLASNY